MPLCDHVSVLHLLLCCSAVDSALDTHAAMAGRKDSWPVTRVPRLCQAVWTCSLDASQSPHNRFAALPDCLVVWLSGCLVVWQADEQR